MAQTAYGMKIINMSDEELLEEAKTADVLSPQHYAILKFEIERRDTKHRWLGLRSASIKSIIALILSSLSVLVAVSSLYWSVSNNKISNTISPTIQNQTNK